MSNTIDGTTESRTVVILDRINPGDPEPDYCVHGRATCMGDCGEWLWLGSETVAVVTSGQAWPICLECALKVIPPTMRPERRVVDHPRHAGPH